MSRTEKALVVLLRIGGVLTLLALGAAFMPHAWMDAVHRALGLGELPRIPIIGYLTRSLSAMYALHGALVLFLSFDVRRYLPAIRFLSVLAIMFGAGLIVLDVYVGLPQEWVLGEGPFVMVLGAVLLWLAMRIEEK
jgi:hypothetical protein